ncbi:MULTISPECIES: hypothetical protein [unclassified Streptomyces]|uniref:hypothetical protein n=1 Tax=unclassified Streptomyces TaxID=2593676 RepID=UPI00087E9706|nr:MULTISPECIES: hypothetical protein [unclassified Streptomyces]PBC83917.1 hypothetical protein BX261_3882 [Streptomyces sp. 2321.6]SDR37183.1 hypothetical protein SAMN05216511_3317 [Streptomyces sp. KS_16]SED13474.1 hypothetical protein SAMN05428940_3909 [Streptomyces sp. 2133.1]SNC69995.1 hypothetical protein SAMN06272741_3875 [Streptomyces sp. 2114.4]
MSGTTRGRYDPFDSCGPSGAARQGYPAASGRPLGPVASGRSLGPVRELYAAREAQGHPGGERGAGHPGEEPGAGRPGDELRAGLRRGETAWRGAKSGQNSGDGDDIGVAEQAAAGADDVAATTDDATARAGGAPVGTAGGPLGALARADAGEGPDGHTYGSDSEEHTGTAFGGGTGDGHGRSHPTGGFGGFGGEDDLRRLLQSSVGGLEPAPDALEQLRRAVPARRQRRRHAVLGAAAALLLGGTSIPAMVHVVNLADGSEERAAKAASNQYAQGGTGGAHGEGTEQAGPRPSRQGGETPGGGAPQGDGQARGKNGAGPGAGAGTPGPDETMDVTSPACGRNQLGNGSSTVGPADSTGRIYGTFRVVNTSGAACSVEGGGTVGLVAHGSTNPDHIHVVDHTSGDEATGLPDPATTPDQLVLKPGQAYEVKFAWIPQSGGGTTGCVNPGPSPTPAPSKDPGQSPDAGATAAGDSGGGSGSGGGQAGGDEGSGGGSASGGIVLTHTPEAGEPSAADAKVTDACAGTVYRTEALAAP